MSNYDPMDPKSQAEARFDKDLKARLAQETEESDIRWLMSSKRGRRIVWRLLEHTGVFRLSFNTNAMQMAFNEGNRNFGNRTLDMIQNYCPEMYTQMSKENGNASRHAIGSGRNTQ
jgi:hypothetical protein